MRLDPAAQPLLAGQAAAGTAAGSTDGTFGVPDDPRDLLDQVERVGQVGGATAAAGRRTVSPCALAPMASRLATVVAASMSIPVMRGRRS